MSKLDEIDIPNFSATLPPFVLENKAREWLEEDMQSFDFAGIVVGEMLEEAILICKSIGVLSGIPFANAVFKLLECKVEWHCLEGQILSSFKHVATVKGNARNILMAERLVLNILSRASGVATHARKAHTLSKTAGWKGKVAGTRKTTPGFRLVEKYSLLVGGVAQHRNNLSSMVMLKDNHIWAVEGDVTKAVKLAREACGFSQKVEVECRSYDEASRAAAAGAEIVMLDNFEAETAKKVAEQLKKSFPHLLVEVSGGITLENITQYFSNHIDVLSMSELTQGYSCLDFSMKINRENRDPLNPLVHNSGSPSDS